MTSLKYDCALLSRLFIACQSRDGNLERYFAHENQPWPPSLSQVCKMRQGQNADLVKCLESLSESKSDAPAVGAKVLDGTVLVQKLSPGTATTFQEYADNVFIAYIVRQPQTANRVDVIWDVYQPDSLKKAIREKRGTGTRRRVTPSSRIPGNWKSFLRVDENKTELFAFLGEQVERTRVDDKELYSTCGQFVLSSRPREDTSDIAPCTHEEADTRILLHVLDAVDTTES